MTREELIESILEAMQRSDKMSNRVKNYHAKKPFRLADNTLKQFTPWTPENRDKGNALAWGSEKASRRNTRRESVRLRK